MVLLLLVPAVLRLMRTRPVPPAITAGLAPIELSTTFRQFRFSVLIDIKPLLLLVAPLTTAFLLTASSISLLVWALFLKMVS